MLNVRPTSPICSCFALQKFCKDNKLNQKDHRDIHCGMLIMCLPVFKILVIIWLSIISPLPPYRQRHTYAHYTLEWKCRFSLWSELITQHNRIDVICITIVKDNTNCQEITLSKDVDGRFMTSVIVSESAHVPSCNQQAPRWDVNRKLP